MKPLSKVVTGIPQWSVMRGMLYILERTEPKGCKIIANVYGPTRLLANRRNARLIAAAPDLLAALRHAYSRLNAIPHNYAKTDFRLIEAALAKASKARRA